MDMSLGPGDVLLGKYRIERVLGKGGMGVVVAARHIELGQPYAIKFLLPSVLTHHESLERFLREARASARLQSEHVAHVHDVGRMENGAPYMVMEYLDGCDLKALVTKGGPLPADVAMTYLAHVCDAIAEAHAAGIVHRDLKPANLFLVRRRNGSPCVKVLDFGISKHIGTEEVDLTGTNMTLGSPLYMSPEQISKSKTVDTRTDIWALGVILYELLTGRSPFRGGTALEVVSRVLQEEPTPIRELLPSVPERAEYVIARCLRKRREERFQTVEELLAVLEGRETSALSSQSSVIARTAPEASTTASGRMPSGEPTSVAFGQTDRQTIQNKANPVVLAVAAGAGVVLVGLTVFGVLASRNEPAAPAAPSAPAPVDTAFVAPSSVVVAPIPDIDATAPVHGIVQDAGSSEGGAPNAAMVESTAAPVKARPAPTMTTQAPSRESSPTTTTKKKRSAL